MKKIVTLLFALFLAVTASAQSHIFPAYDSNNVFTGSNTFQGAFVLPSLGVGCLATTAGGTVTVTAGCGGAGLTSFQGRTTSAAVLLASDINGVLAPLTNCGSAGFTYSPASNTCIQSGALFPVTTGLVINTSQTAARTAISGTDFQDSNLSQFNTFRSSLSNYNNGLTSIVLIGDDTLNGNGPATLPNTIAYQLQTYFSAYKLAGSGIVPVLGAGSGVTLNPEWTKTGTISGSSDLGPFQTGTLGDFTSTAILAGTGTSVTMTPVSNVNSLTVYGETSTDTAGGCLVSIDGGASTTVGNSITGAPGVYRTTINSSLGTHTVTITGNASTNCRLYGVEWTNGTNGIEVHRLAHTGAITGAWSTTSQLAYIAAMSPLPQMAVVMLGNNDNLNSVAQATVQTNLSNLLTQLKTINPQMSVLFYNQQNMNTAGTGVTAAQIKTIQQGLTANSAAGYLSLSDSWGSYAAANTNGLMNGNVNPSSKGALAAAALLFANLTEGQVPVSNVSGFATLNANLFTGLQILQNSSTNPATIIPSIAFTSVGTGYDEGLAWYDGTSAYPSTTSLKWKLGKASNNTFYGLNTVLGTNWLSVDPTTNNVTLTGSLTAPNATLANLTVSSTLTTNALNVSNLHTAFLVATSAITGASFVVINPASGTTGPNLAQVHVSGPNDVAFLNMGGTIGTVTGPYQLLNGLQWQSATPTELAISYDATILFYPNPATAPGGYPNIVFDNTSSINYGGLIGSTQAGTLLAFSGVGTAATCQISLCNWARGTFTVVTDGSSNAGTLATLTTAKTRPTSMWCHAFTPEDTSSNIRVAVTGTTSTLITFSLLNAGYNSSAKTMLIQYECGK